MFRRPRFGWAAVAAAIALTAWAGLVARGADDPAEKTPKPAKGAAKSAEGASKSPEEMLSARGLTRSGARYILEKQEEECFNKFDEIRPRYEQLETSYNKVAAIAMNEAQIAELQAEQAMTQQQLQVAIAQGNSMPRYGRYARYTPNPTAQHQQQLRVQQSALAQQLAMAKQQAVSAKDKQEAVAQYDQHRTELTESATEVRELFEKVQKDYTEIEAEPPVRAALGALRKPGQAPFKVAPSDKFNKKLAQVKKLERMMRPETASAKGSRSKSSAKSKR